MGALNRRGASYDYAIALSPQLSIERVAADFDLHPLESDEAPYCRYTVVGMEGEILLSRQLFGDVLNESVALIGTSGTGNEQAAGMGKPVFGFWGRGPQITEKFMRAQKRLLGPSLILSPPDPELIADRMMALLQDRKALREIAANGAERMAGRGSIGAMVREIAARTTLPSGHHPSTA
jgi:uncharacterized protein (TIGR03492 family)